MCIWSYRTRKFIDDDFFNFLLNRVIYGNRILENFCLSMNQSDFLDLIAAYTAYTHHNEQLLLLIRLKRAILSAQ